jgi:hypothetical protein
MEIVLKVSLALALSVTLLASAPAIPAQTPKVVELIH